MAKSGMLSDTEVDEGDGKDPKNQVEVTDKSYDDSLCVVNKKNLSAHISILIESLVKNLCTAYEQDEKKANVIYKTICDRLYQMNLIDESYQMKEFEGIRSQYQHAFLHIFAASSGKQPFSIQSLWQDENLATSHYHREFDEIEFIAGGGFGKVYKVRHKLDGTEYAIKKIPIRSEGLEYVKSYLSEVKTFASVNHPNIVQYKAAWLDMGQVDDQDDDQDEETIISLKNNITKEYIYHQNNANSFSKRSYIDNDSSDFEVVFEHSFNGIESHRSLSNHFEKANNKTRRQKRSSVSEGGDAICPLDMVEIDRIKVEQKMQEKWATLYIQMALCQSTLKQWLTCRNESQERIDLKTAILPAKIVHDSTVKEILRQLLEGLQYIHSKRIVHHDIKPSNIFIQTDNDKLLVQLGDFGLACPLQSVRHSLAFGTKLYAAPEQLAGECNPKSDMYSLGIVLLELVESFTTDMERNMCIEELKKHGRLPPRISIQHPQFASIIIRLVSKSPKDRPSASELLEEICDVAGGVDKRIKELKCQLAEKDEEITRLKELLHSVGVKSI